MIRSFEFCRLADGRAVTAYEITNRWGESAVIVNYGAILASLRVLDRDGHLEDVVLGADPGQDISAVPYTGAVMGRCGNRIAYASFTIDGRTYHLTPMEGPHHLHGAGGNWARQFFTAETGENSVTLHLLDDGRDGWECEADAAITYTFDDNHALTIDYRVTAGGDTVLSPTNHSYFNLHPARDVLDTRMQIFTDRYAPKSDLHMPDGRTAPVEGTPLDFTVPRTFREALSRGSETFFPPYQDSFDDFYVIPGQGFRQLAEAFCPENGRVMRVFSDAQSVILYTPVLREPVVNKGGRSFTGHIAFCLEAQFVPNSVNCPEYRSPVFHKGEALHSRTVYAFDVK